MLGEREERTFFRTVFLPLLLFVVLTSGTVALFLYGAQAARERAREDYYEENRIHAERAWSAQTPVQRDQ